MLSKASQDNACLPCTLDTAHLLPADALRPSISKLLMLSFMTQSKNRAEIQEGVYCRHPAALPEVLLLTLCAFIRWRHLRCTLMTVTATLKLSCSSTGRDEKNLAIIRSICNFISPCAHPEQSLNICMRQYRMLLMGSSDSRLLLGWKLEAKLYAFEVLSGIALDQHMLVHLLTDATQGCSGMHRVATVLCCKC